MRFMGEKHERLGRFHVPFELWSEPAFAAQVLAHCIPYEIRPGYHRHAIEVFAYAVSECFRPVQPMELIPEYGLNLTEVLAEEGERTRIEAVFDGFVEGPERATRTRRNAGDGPHGPHLADLAGSAGR